MSYFVQLLQVNLMVRNLDASIEWYVDKLGFKQLKRYGDHTAVLGFNNKGSDPSPAICLIVLGEGEKPSDNPDNSTHPVLQLSPEHRDTIYEELRSKGVKVEEHPRHHAHFRFYDLDDNLLELYSPGIYG